MPAIRLDGTQLEYIERGQGDPVVLVHGTLGDYRSWELQMDAFAATYRTISYSRRYHHPNACHGDETDYSAALHADDLAAFMTGLALESAHIVGESYGAYVALLLAARHPERVRALVLSDPPVFPLLEHSAERERLSEHVRRIGVVVHDQDAAGRGGCGLRRALGRRVGAEGGRIERRKPDDKLAPAAGSVAPGLDQPFTRIGFDFVLSPATEDKAGSDECAG